MFQPFFKSKKQNKDKKNRKKQELNLNKKTQQQQQKNPQQPFQVTFSKLRQINLLHARAFK